MSTGRAYRASRLYNNGTMRTTAQRTLLAVSLFLVIGWAVSCDPEHAHNGCKLQGNGCFCSYGCKYEYPYRNKRECMMAYRERNSNICNHNPCVRGTCLQVNQDPGYSCGCQGTGYYGQRCEKDWARGLYPALERIKWLLKKKKNFYLVCPTVPMRGLTFPYECIVI